MHATVSQWIGRRDHQEDAYAVKHLPGGTLAVVCDGMGGHSCGDLAARTAAHTFVETFVASAEDEPVRSRLENAIMAANRAVGELFAQNGLYGGCTLCGIFITGRMLWWVSVGDSPLLLWRGGHLHRLNEDHSMRSFYADFARAGTMSFKQAMARGHMLRSAVTGASLSMVDLPGMGYMLLPNDRIVLATDGVENLLLVPVLSESARQALSTPLLQASSAIVEACRALEDPVADNTTTIVIDA